MQLEFGYLLFQCFDKSLHIFVVRWDMNSTEKKEK